MVKKYFRNKDDVFASNITNDIQSALWGKAYGSNCMRDKLLHVVVILLLDIAISLREMQKDTRE